MVDEWVTPAEVLDKTGQSVDAAAISSALSVVEVIAGKPIAAAEDRDRLRKRDLRLLHDAVAWQAAHMKTNPEATLAAGNVAAAAANGVSVTYRDGAADPTLGTLGTLAAMSLKRLSWRRSRSVPLLPARPVGRPLQTLVDDGLDSDWTPL